MSLHTLMFGWEYPPRHVGGLGVACQGLVRGLLQHHVRVTLVLPFAGQESGDISMLSPSTCGGSSIHVQSALHPYDNAASYAQRLRKIPHHLHDMYGENLEQAIAHYTEESVALTQHVDADVIHCHDWMTYEAGIRTAGSHERPLVTHIHATELDRTHFHPNEWIYRRERRGFEMADRIIAVSNYTKNILTQHYGISPDKIHVVHNSITQDHAGEPVPARKNAPPMVLFLGRLTAQKGAWQFLEMARRVHEYRPDVLFVIAGEGDMLSELIDRACTLHLQDSVIFAGRVRNAEAKTLYTQAACFVMPSASEPFGLVALESIAHGTPVILSKQSGAAEVIDHALKVDFWDTEMMADCVLTVLREQPLAEQLRCEAPRLLQTLTWHRQAGKVHSLYQELSGKKPARCEPHVSV